MPAKKQKLNRDFPTGEKMQDLTDAGNLGMIMKHHCQVEMEQEFPKQIKIYIYKVFDKDRDLYGTPGNLKQMITRINYRHNMNLIPSLEGEKAWLEANPQYMPKLKGVKMPHEGDDDVTIDEKVVKKLMAESVETKVDGDNGGVGETA